METCESRGSSIRLEEEVSLAEEVGIESLEI